MLSASRESEKFSCPICGRETPQQFQEKHHLVPKCKKGREVVVVCINCGDQIHKLFDIRELKKELNTIEEIKNHPDIQKWVKWISKRTGDFRVSMASKKRR